MSGEATTSYKQIFRHLYGMRDRLRRSTVVMIGDGKPAVLAINGLRALGAPPVCLLGRHDAEATSPSSSLGIPMKPAAELASLDETTKRNLVVVVASNVDDEALEAHLGRLALPNAGQIVRLAGLPDVPMQQLSPTSRRLADPERRRRFMARELRIAKWRYWLAITIAETLFSVYFICCRTGWQYGVTRRAKLKLAWRAFANTRHFRSLSRPAQQLWLVHELFKVPSTMRGDVAECGCYDGASTAVLSLACQLVNRTLYVCDSFEGLPEPDQAEALTIRTGASFYRWKKGEFASPGGLEGVKAKLRRHGAIEACRFVPGYFRDTLPDLPTDSLVMVFEDADLRSSVLDCLTYLWPRLQYSCKFFSHEPWSVDVVSLFFDRDYWRTRFGCPAPGFYGGDTGGVRAAAAYFTMGFAVKRDTEAIAARGTQVRISGSL